MKEEVTRLIKTFVFLTGTAMLLTQPALSQSDVAGPLVNNAVALTKNTPRPVMTGQAQVTSQYNPAQMLRLVLGLKHPNIAAEEQFLTDVQDRNSPLFHHFLTQDEWTARFSPSAADEQALVDWATAQGLVVTKRFPDRLIVDVQAPVSVVNRAFGFTINNYQMGATSFFSNDRDPVVPTALSSVLESVLGANNLQVVGPAIKNFQADIGGNPYTAGPFLSNGISDHKDAVPGAARPGAAKKGVTSNVTNGYYDPSDIYASTAYNYSGLQNLGHCCNPTNNSGGTPADTSIAIATFSAYDKSTGKYQGGFNGNDISGFQAQYPYLAYHYLYFNVDGNPGECCDDETTLDIEWSTATSNSFGSYQNTAYIKPFIGANNHLSTFADVFTAIKNDNTTRIVSTSWGCAEDCWGSGGTSTLHGIINSMSAEGWTVVASSGDAGATDDCSTLSVGYPASDPNVVAAGGTTLYTGPSGYSSETGWTGGTASGSCSRNGGGSGGGCSAVYSAPGYQSSPACGSGSRSLPDMALNASIGQNYYFNGNLGGVGGTSIVAPELAGFFAQSAAYVLYITAVTGNPNGCYGGGSGACLPLGNANTFLYYFGNNPNYPYHYPFYDITSGCNSNDVTAANGTGYYCAAAGYDRVTGWGSANMLQLAWAINSYLAGNWSSPTVAFGGAATGTWYNTTPSVNWTITGHTGDVNPVNGIAGYTDQWDLAISDPRSEATPGSGNAFYSGPAVPNATTGSSSLPAVQGCHTLYVYAWDNAGYPSGNQAYGTLCYDTVPPATTVALAGTIVGGEYDGPVKVTLSASDPAPGSGVAATYYQLDSAGYILYSGAFTVGTDGTHTVNFYSVDVAGNIETVHSTSFTIRSGQTAALEFVPITPCRVVDTRNATGTFGGPELAAGSTRAFPIRNSGCAIPATAMAYSLNVTVVPPAKLGYLTIWPYGTSQPTASTLNSDGRVKANAAIVPAGSDAGGSANVYVTNATQLVLDIDGYFVPAGTPNVSGLQFYSLTPCRVVDTRNANGPLGGPSINGGTFRSFPVNTACNIPSTATAYSLNFTAVPHQSLGYITAWPEGQSQPLASVLNAPTGTVVANAAIIPAGSPSGGVSVYANANTDVVIDIDGYFAPPASKGLWLYTVSPCRVLDTRNGAGAFSGTLVVNVESSSCSVNSAAQAYVLNATVVPSGHLPYLTLWPDTESQPLVSTLNASDGAITSNMAITPTLNGKVDAFAASNTQLVLDISGYFAP